MTKESRMLSLLGAAMPAPEYADELMVFGRFAGSWDLDARFIDGELETRITGEWHFDWILEGRALQEVLIFPALASSGDALKSEHRIGTCVRFYDAEAALWRVVWINPSSGAMYKLTGGLIEEQIVLHGDPHDGVPTQWIFSEMTDTSFLWRALESDDDGETWHLVQEMRAQRRK